MKTVTYNEVLWKLVPIEPTEEILAAIQQATNHAVFFDEAVINAKWTAHALYRAMLAAAPAPQPTGDKHDDQA